MTWPTDRTDAAVLAAKDGWSCDICGAPKGKWCKPRPDLPDDLKGRILHLGRMTDRRREKKGEA